jgi:hypothetical protein
MELNSKSKYFYPNCKILQRVSTEYHEITQTSGRNYLFMTAQCSPGSVF